MVLFHKRAKDGSLVPPPQLLDRQEIQERTKAPESLEQELARLEALRNAIPPANFAQMQETVRQKWASGARDRLLEEQRLEEKQDG